MSDQRSAEPRTTCPLCGAPAKAYTADEGTQNIGYDEAAARALSDRPDVIPVDAIQAIKTLPHITVDRMLGLWVELDSVVGLLEGWRQQASKAQRPDGGLLAHYRLRDSLEGALRRLGYDIAADAVDAILAEMSR